MSDAIIIPKSVFESTLDDMQKALFEEWLDAKTVQDREDIYVRMLAVQGVVEDIKIKVMRINNAR